MKEKQDLVVIIRNNILIFAIYLYFAGWTFAYKYYADLGIQITSLDVPVYYFFIYSFSALKYGVFLLLLFFVGIYYYYLNHNQKAVIIVLIALLPLIYILSWHSATTSAMSFRRDAVTSYKSVNILVNDKSTIYQFDNFSSLNASGKLKIITSNKDYCYLLYQPKGDNRALPEGYTFKVSTKNIIMTKTAIY
jgi:hypothetical protein